MFTEPDCKFYRVVIYSCVNLQVIGGAQIVELEELAEGRPGDAQ